MYFLSKKLVICTTVRPYLSEDSLFIRACRKYQILFEIHKVFSNKNAYLLEFIIKNASFSTYNNENY